MIDANNISIYLHWPFCESKCPYCDFNSHVREKVVQDEWLQGYLKNIRLWVSIFPNPKIKTVYFGGGTPSLMEPNIVSDLLEGLDKYYSIANNIEISLEANPSSVEIQKFRDYASAGINRISIGVQSFVDKDLRLLGRRHSAKEALSAVEIGTNIFENLSFDLIYGRQFQSLLDWEQELQFAISLRSQHLSLYQLTVEKNTAFGKLFDKGKLKGLPSDELSRKLFMTTNDICYSNGYKPYEISNFALDKQECKHNVNYWKCGNFLGIGPGAHGRYQLNQKRFSYESIKNPETWLNKSFNEDLAINVKKRMSDLDHFEEFVIMGLRLSEGLSLSKMHKNFGKRFDEKILQELISLGFIEIASNQLKVLQKGKVLLNYITKELLT